MTRPVKTKNRVRATSTNSARRDEILAAACGIFAAMGFTSATMRDVADAAGILPGSLYHHFESKDEILEESLRGYLDQIVVETKAVAARQLDPPAAINALIGMAFDGFIHGRSEATIILNDFSYLSEQDRFAFVNEQVAQLQRIWIAELKRGVSAGMFRDDLDVSAVCRAMFGSILAAGRWYRPTGRLAPDKLAAQWSSLFLGGLLRPGQDA